MRSGGVELALELGAVGPLAGQREVRQKPRAVALDQRRGQHARRDDEDADRGRRGVDQQTQPEGGIAADDQQGEAGGDQPGRELGPGDGHQRDDAEPAEQQERRLDPAHEPGPAQEVVREDLLDHLDVRLDPVDHLAERRQAFVRTERQDGDEDDLSFQARRVEVLMEKPVRRDVARVDLGLSAERAEVQPEGAVALGREAGRAWIGRVAEHDLEPAPCRPYGGEETAGRDARCLGARHQEERAADALHGLDAAQHEAAPGAEV